MAKKETILDHGYSNRIKPFNYRDAVRTKKGKLRSWTGHLRVIRELEPKTLPMRFERCQGVGYGFVRKKETEDA